MFYCVKYIVTASALSWAELKLGPYGMSDPLIRE